MGRARSSAHLRWARNTAISSGVDEDRVLSIVSIVGRRAATVTRRLASAADVETLVRESDAACRQAPEAPDYMPLLPGSATPPNWRHDAASSGIAVFAPMIPALSAALQRCRQAGIQTAGAAEYRDVSLWIATSTGRRLRHDDRSGSLTVTGMTDDGERSSWSGASVQHFGGESVALVFEPMRSRLDWTRRRIPLPAGEYDVLLSPSCTAELAIATYSMMSRRLADEGRSPFSADGGGTRLGERLFGTLTLYSDPHEPDLPSAPFHAAVSSGPMASVFDTGLPAERTDWVRDGELRALVTPRSWAATVGAPAATPYIENLIVAGGGTPLDAMIASSDRALLITSFWYLAPVGARSGRLTGLTRDGVFVIEGGRVRGATNDFRWTMSPIAALAQAVEYGPSARAVAREHQAFRRVKAPPVRIERFRMSAVADGRPPAG